MLKISCKITKNVTSLQPRIKCLSIKLTNDKTEGIKDYMYMTVCAIIIFWLMHGQQNDVLDTGISYKFYQLDNKLNGIQVLYS